APRLVLVRAVEHGYAGEDHGLVLARDLDVVLLAARIPAWRRKLEPHDTGADTHHGDRAAGDLDRAARAGVLRCELAKQREQPGRRARGIRRQVGARGGELAQAVVDGTDEVHHLQVSLEQRDRGQEALAL